LRYIHLASPLRSSKINVPMASESAQETRKKSVSPVSMIKDEGAASESVPGALYVLVLPNSDRVDVEEACGPKGEKPQLHEERRVEPLTRKRRNIPNRPHFDR